MSAVDTAISITNLIGGAASFGSRALPVAKFLASFIPGAAPVLAGIELALPWIERVASVAPAAVKAIESGRPIFDAISNASPILLPALKQIYAIAVNADPNRPETNMTAADVSNEAVMTFAGPVLMRREWTTEEQQRWWDKAQGQGF